MNAAPLLPAVTASPRPPLVVSAVLASPHEDDDGDHTMLLSGMGVETRRGVAIIILMR